MVVYVGRPSNPSFYFMQSFLNVGGVWCAKSGLTAQTILMSLDNSRVSFRGQFRDFGLFVEDSELVSNCEVFKAHTIGDDGLWVIEEGTIEQANVMKAKLREAGQTIYYENKLSYVVSGGSDLTNIAGLDGCGADVETSAIPVPSHSVAPQHVPLNRLEKWKRSAKNIPFSKSVETAVEAVTTDSLVTSVGDLQSFYTRNSYSETLYEAQSYIVDRLTSLGFDIEYVHFKADMAPNLVATWSDTTNATEWVVAGAHMDSRAQDSKSGTVRAPGADDNATGSSALLEIAEIVTSLKPQVNRGLRLCFFTGEEQGLLGSRALASAWAQRGDDIYGMINADMLGYQSTPAMQIGFMNRSVSAELTTYVKEIAAVYVPSIPTVETSACCSDYAAFYENGYPSVGFFESSNGATAYPSYHTTTDLLENINTEQLTLQVQAIVAAVWTLLLE
jgi:hypothetical protein